MTANIKAEMVSRRKALSLMGLVLHSASRQPLRCWRSPMLRPKPLACSGVKSDVQVGSERRDERRTGRTERREERRTGTARGHSSSGDNYRLS